MSNKACIHIHRPSVTIRIHAMPRIHQPCAPSPPMTTTTCPSLMLSIVSSIPSHPIEQWYSLLLSHSIASTDDSRRHGDHNQGHTRHDKLQSTINAGSSTACLCSNHSINLTTLHTYILLLPLLPAMPILIPSAFGYAGLAASSLGFVMGRCTL